MCQLGKAVERTGRSRRARKPRSHVAWRAAAEARRRASTARDVRVSRARLPAAAARRAGARESSAAAHW
jgi:hypothetical protein